MPSIDMPLEQMRQFKPPLYREQDFESYWDTTVKAAMKQPLHSELIPYDLPIKGFLCYALRFDGFEGGRLAGWYVRPDAPGKFPGVCVFHGYSMRAARPLDLMQYACQGLCVLSMDCRGQNGQSQDLTPYPEGHAVGWMTAGLRDPDRYYFRYVYADALRALELLAQRDEVNDRRLAITGGSQGGGITLAVAALSKRPILALADTFLCDFRRGMQIAPAGPYLEFATFLKAHPHLYDQAVRTLSYVDNLNLAPWITCRTVICNALWDDMCPPSTIYAVYNQMTAEKQMELYPFHEHEVPYDHQETKLRLLNSVLMP